MSEAQIECRDLWKIYGRRSDEAMKAVLSEGLSKEEVRDRFDCVLGVRNASFSVKKGEIFCIMGLSGSGKSTLVRHVNRLIEPTAGEIHVAGQRVDTMGETELRQLRAETIGMVFQHMALWPHRTLGENVGFGLEVRDISAAERRAAAEKALAAMDLTGWIDHYPDQLSGGMQQRVGLARALAADPQILLMDEPFSALDPLIRREMQDEFLRLQEMLGKTIVFITHDFDEALRLADRIAIMKDGVVEQCDTPDQIVLNPATEYVAKFTEEIEKSRVVHAGVLAREVNGHSLTGAPVGDKQTISELARLLVNDCRDFLPVANNAGALVGAMNRQEALDVLLGEGS